MALDNRLEIRLLQKLILTPQLQQAIKLLQMPQLELSQSLTNELMENPFLEEVAEEIASLDEDPEGREAAEAESGLEQEPESDYSEAPLEKLMNMTETDDYFEERGFDGRDLGYFNPGTVAQPSFESFVSKEGDLQDHLLWQLRLSPVEGRIREAAEVVIGNLDENGYLQATVEDIAGMAGCTVEEAGQVLKLVQSFDPTGVGARDLQECLLLQLDSLGLRGSLVESLITNNLHDLEKKRYNQIAKQYNCGTDEVLAAVKVIEKLEPKPGRNYSNASPVYVTPDVFVVKSEGEFHIILNDEGLPKLRLTHLYKKLISQKNSLQKEEKQFIDEKLNQAKWLLKSLDQRNRTIYKVAESILNFQRDFFEKGRSQLKPLNLRDMATELGLHESTISRATSSKYLACDRGLFSLKFFFSGGVQGSNGKVSSTSVKDLIKKMVLEEDTQKPLSDQEIVALCKGSGIEIARRTVAKYRNELKIAPQSQRKRFNQ